MQGAQGISSNDIDLIVLAYSGIKTERVKNVAKNIGRSNCKCPTA